VIRVLIAPRSSEVENAIRSSPSLVFAGAVDPQHWPAEVSGDVLLMELADAKEHDWPALAELPIPIVVLLDSTDSALIGAALRAGIRSVLSWDATPQEIESAVQAVHAGLVAMTPASLAALLPDAQLFNDELAEALSGREQEVLDLLAEGLSNKLIAQGLNISEHTVKTHVASIFVKLGASSRTEAVSQAIRRGLVML